LFLQIVKYTGCPTVWHPPPREYAFSWLPQRDSDSLVSCAVVVPDLPQTEVQ
jgi:hypothetical protein